jgi:formyltetrahydrofolate synthetase
VNGYVEEKKAKKKEVIQKENEEFDFIYDSNIPIPDKISQFITITYNEEIPIDNIKSYLDDEVDDIITKLSENSTQKQ